MMIQAQSFSASQQNQKGILLGYFGEKDLRYGVGEGL